MLGGRAADLFGRRRVFLARTWRFHRVQPARRSGAERRLAHQRPSPPGRQRRDSGPGDTESCSLLRSPNPPQRRRALGAWSATAASGAAIGVLAGGAAHRSTRLAVGADSSTCRSASALLAAAVVGPASDRRWTVSLRRLDVPGARGGDRMAWPRWCTGSSGTDTHPWSSAWTLSRSLALGAALARGVRADRSRGSPSTRSMPLGVFRRRSLSAANGVSRLRSAGRSFSVFFFLSLYLQQVNGLHAAAGRARHSCLWPYRSCAAALLAVQAGRHGSECGCQLVIGLLLAAGGLAWMTQPGT